MGQIGTVENKIDKKIREAERQMAEFQDLIRRWPGSDAIAYYNRRIAYFEGKRDAYRDAYREMQRS